MSDIQDNMHDTMKERLRRLVSLREQRTRPAPTYNVADFDAQGNHVADAQEFEGGRGEDLREELTVEDAVKRSKLPLHRLVPGHEIANAAGQCYCTVQAFPLEEARGPYPLGSLLDLPPALFHRFHPTFGVGKITDYRRAAFIDTETTGLGGGAGVYCFMVGVGTFEPYQPLVPDQRPAAPEPGAPATHFVVRQFFMRNPAEEGALLIALAELLASYEMTVTFNGRSFDLPLLRMRYTQNRRCLPLDHDAALLQADRPHLDLLMPARKVWRRRLQSCRLINLEQMILGLQRSEDDVPGHLIPELYQHYVQTGHAEAMRRVFYHNHEDIVTMVALADHLSRAFGDITASVTPPSSSSSPPAMTAATPTSAAVTGMDWAGLGRAHERAGDFTQAEAAYTRALESVRNPGDRGEIFHALGEIYKRQGQWTQAAETWQSWITSIPGSDPTPFVELAKYCEWEIHDLSQAEMWTAWALHNLQKAHPAARNPTAQRDLEHRLARIQRKRTGSTEPPTSA
jgi:uncharacterized protein YprB with RNaseH-like and TPR domain